MTQDNKKKKHIAQESSPVRRPDGRREYGYMVGRARYRSFLAAQDACGSSGSIYEMHTRRYFAPNGLPTG